MKVYIGNYVYPFGPKQIAEKLLFWLDENDDNDRKIDKLGDWLGTDRNGNDNWLTKLCDWIYSKRKRRAYVKIDYPDVWSMDSTLTYIILPMLHELKKHKMGSPNVADDDVPDHLKSTNAPPKEHEWDTDDNWHARWEWVLDELIWTFENHHPDSDGESQFYDHSDVDHSGGLMEMVASMKVDRDGLAAYHLRKQKGFELFGKYYMGLWS